MKRSIVETLLGLIVLIGAGSFAYYGYSFLSVTQKENTHNVQAYFNGAGGLNKGADVRMAGVVIGKVSSIVLDNENFHARVDMEVQNDIMLPQDTLVEIASDGFIGGKYIRLSVQSNDAPIGKTSVLKNTKDVETLEQMLGKLIFLTTD